MKKLYRAVRRRRSVRNYADSKLPTTRLDEIEEDLQNRRRFEPEVSVSAQLIRDGRSLQEDISGIIADYGKVEAPHYIALTSEDSENGYVELGYSYEFVVLTLAAGNIGSCWIGKGFQDEKLNQHAQIPSGQSCVALIALGPLPEEDDLGEIEEPKRKELSHFLVDRKPGSLTEETLGIIDCLRRSPSALNGQPWRVIVNENSIHLYLGKRSRITRIVLKNLNQLNRVDAGIGLCHLEVGGEYFWDNGEVKKSSHPERRDLIYIGSLVGQN